MNFRSPLESGAIKTLKRIFFAISVAILIILLLALFTRRDYSVEREITIKRPRQQVFDFFKILENQVYYNPWVIKYPSEKMEYYGKDGEVGFRHVWNSQITEVGEGEEKIKHIEQGKRIDIELHFIRPFDRWADSWLTTDSIGNDQTKVKWGFAGSIKYPLNAILIFMNLEKQLGDQLSIGLAHAKKRLES